MHIKQITTSYIISLAELLQQFEFPTDTPPTAAIKDLKSDRFSVTSLSTWLQTRGTTDTGTPAEATPATATPASTTAPPAFVDTAVPAPTEHVAPYKTIN